VGSQVELERERREQEAQPWVVPAPDPSWTWKNGEAQYAVDAWKKLLPVKNVGPGAALNVVGTLNWPPPSGVTVDILPTSIGPGDREDLRVNWASAPRAEWRRVEGTLEYDDVIHRRWQTRFVIEEKDSVRTVQVDTCSTSPGRGGESRAPTQSQRSLLRSPQLRRRPSGCRRPVCDPPQRAIPCPSSVPLPCDAPRTMPASDESASRDRDLPGPWTGA
jgi:hypothetical protein